MHYHQINVKDAQKSIKPRSREALLADIMSPPIMVKSSDKPSPEEIRAELEENCQSILGYVVRWVEMGIGCSKVPDVKNVQLMEDRATLRISSQLLANWLRHNLITDTQLEQGMKKMAVVVDQQNAKDAGYTAMSPNFEKSLGFHAALELVRNGRTAK